MTDGKKSFILHNDYQDYFALLSREERGDLIMAVFDYNRNGVLPDFDGSILMAFTMIRNQIERDALRYEARCERNKGNIAKRWKEKDTTVYDGKSGKGSYTKHTDNGNDTDNVNDNVNDNANVNDIPKGIYISSVQQELDDGRETVDLNEAFDKAYQKYPRRDGKAKGKQLYMQYLKGRDIKGQGKVKFNHHQIYIAIQAFADEMDGRDKDKIKLFDTFMNTPVIDYVDKTKTEYQAAMKSKYGEEWDKVKFRYTEGK